MRKMTQEHQWHLLTPAFPPHVLLLSTIDLSRLMTSPANVREAALPSTEARFNWLLALLCNMAHTI